MVSIEEFFIRHFLRKLFICFYNYVYIKTSVKVLISTIITEHVKSQLVLEEIELRSVATSFGERTELYLFNVY